MLFMPEMDMIMMATVWGLSFQEDHNQVEVAAIGKHLHMISYSIWQVIFLDKIAGLFAMLAWHLKATFLKCTIYLLLGAVVGVEAEVVVDEAAKVAVMEAAITAALLQEGQITELSSLVSRRHNFI